MEKSFNAAIVNRQELAADAYEVTFELSGHDFSFVPGQYVWVVLTALKYPDERGNRRAFSIVAKPGDDKNRLRVLFRKSNSGFKKSLVSLPLGAIVRIDGPFGFCTLPPDQAAPVVFLAGGVGIASVYTMISYAIAQGPARRIIFIYANKNLARAVYLDELKNWQAENKNFTLIMHFGDLNQEVIFNNAKDVVNPAWYVFGPEAMVSAVGDILLSNHVPLDSIETEEFRLRTSPFYQENLKIINTKAGFKMALDHAFNHIILTDADGKIVYANHGAEIITGYSVKEMLGNTPRLWGGLMDGDFYKTLWRTIKTDRQVFAGEIKNRKKSGDGYTARAKISPIFHPQSKDLIGFVGTEEDITKEKEAEKAKAEFISIASHQLRTPLTGIRWVAEMMIKKEKLTDKGREYLNDIQISARRLAQLVDLLLNTSRLEEGKMTISPQALEVVSFVKNFIGENTPLCDKKEITMRFITAVEAMTVTTDMAAFQNIIQSVISNAIEYTLAGGRIEVGLKKSRRTFLLTVSDTGVGIPQAEQSKIFQKFGRASNAQSYKTDGTGLGLYIAKQAAELLGGKIWFSSAENKGTTFYVELPLVSAPIKGTKKFI